MAAKKKGEKRKVALGSKTKAVKNAVVPAGRSRTAEQTKNPALSPAKVRGNTGPTARTCPLVMDGEIDVADFSPVLCLACEEFDCRFCEAAAGSGVLRSRLFAVPDDEERDDDWDSGESFREEEDDDADIDEAKIF